MTVRAGALVLLLMCCALASASPATAQDPFEEMGTCPGNQPGPEPGRTVLQLCVPRLVRAWVDNGLVRVPEAKRLQPIPVGRLSFAEQTGDPPKLLLGGGVRLLGGLELTNRDRVRITTRVDVVYWDGRSRYGREGHRQLRLRPGTRVRVRGHSVVELVSAEGTATVRLKRFVVTED